MDQHCEHENSGLGAFVLGSLICAVGLMGMKMISDSAARKRGEPTKGLIDWLFRGEDDRPMPPATK